MVTKLSFCRLMGVYQYNVGQADSHWALLGSAIKVGDRLFSYKDVMFPNRELLKIAQNIGLSRLGSEKADMKWPEAWQNPLKREIGRRVWWNMVSLLQISEQISTPSDEIFHFNRSSLTGLMQLHITDAIQYIPIRISRISQPMSTMTIFKTTSLSLPDLLINIPILASLSAA